MGVVRIVTISIGPSPLLPTSVPELCTRRPPQTPWTTHVHKVWSPGPSSRSPHSRTTVVVDVTVIVEGLPPARGGSPEGERGVVGWTPTTWWLPVMIVS